MRSTNTRNALVGFTGVLLVLFGVATIMSRLGQTTRRRMPFHPGLVGHAKAAAIHFGSHAHLSGLMHHAVSGHSAWVTFRNAMERWLDNEGTKKVIEEGLKSIAEHVMEKIVGDLKFLNYLRILNVCDENGDLNPVYEDKLYSKGIKKKDGWWKSKEKDVVAIHHEDAGLVYLIFLRKTQLRITDMQVLILPEGRETTYSVTEITDKNKFVTYSGDTNKCDAGIRGLKEMYHRIFKSREYFATEYVQWRNLCPDNILSPDSRVVKLELSDTCI